MITHYVLYWFVVIGGDHPLRAILVCCYRMWSPITCCISLLLSEVITHCVLYWSVIIGGDHPLHVLLVWIIAFNMSQVAEVASEDKNIYQLVCDILISCTVWILHTYKHAHAQAHTHMHICSFPLFITCSIFFILPMLIFLYYFPFHSGGLQKTKIEERKLDSKATAEFSGCFIITITVHV